MFGWLRRNGNCAGCRNLAEAVADLQRQVKALDLDVDDLHDRFKRWQGRQAKRDALDAQPDLRLLPGGRPAPPRASRGDLPSITDLKRTGRYPFPEK